MSKKTYEMNLNIIKDMCNEIKKLTEYYEKNYKKQHEKGIRINSELIGEIRFKMLNDNYYSHKKTMKEIFNF